MSRGGKSLPTLERVEAEIDKINSSSLLPPDVKIERIYDRSGLIHTTTHTVMHNLVFGVVLVFVVQSPPDLGASSQNVRRSLPSRYRSVPNELPPAHEVAMSSIDVPALIEDLRSRGVDADPRVVRRPDRRRP